MYMYAFKSASLNKRLVACVIRYSGVYSLRFYRAVFNINLLIHLA